MWLKLRRGAEGGYRRLAVLEDTPENYERMKATWIRMDLKGIDARIVRMASLYQDEKLSISGLYVNRANRRREKKLQRDFDRQIERQNKKIEKYVANQPLFDPTAMPLAELETTPVLA